MSNASTLFVCLIDAISNYKDARFKHDGIKTNHIYFLLVNCILRLLCEALKSQIMWQKLKKVTVAGGICHMHSIKETKSAGLKFKSLFLS